MSSYRRVSHLDYKNYRGIPVIRRELLEGSSRGIGPGEDEFGRGEGEYGGARQNLLLQQ